MRVFPRCSGHGHAHLFTSLPLLLLPSPFLLCCLVLISIFPSWPRKRLFKHDFFFYTTSDLHRHFGATSAILFRDRASIHIIPFRSVGRSVDRSVGRFSHLLRGPIFSAPWESETPHLLVVETKSNGPKMFGPNLEPLLISVLYCTLPLWP